MRRLGPTTAALARYRRDWQALSAMAARAKGAALDGAAPVSSRLQMVEGFGSNPGNLLMRQHRPERLADAPALVVVLHGCTQTAAGYDHGAGWSTLADRYGFVAVFPEQQRANNPNGCFNWFQPDDTARGRGEALSIRQMVARATSDHGIEPRRVFVTGLSAGGAMTAVMLAAYPDVFAGGAIVAGLPYGAAGSVQDAFRAMYESPSRPAREWGNLVRAASSHRGPWPKVSIWHGSADATVVPSNAGEIVKQWTDVHGLPERPTASGIVDGYPRQVWRTADGTEVIESYTITGMAHGTPLATGDGEDSLGAAGPFLLEAGISSSYHIARFWGLTGERMPASGDAGGRPAPARPSPVETPAQGQILLPGPGPSPRGPDAGETDPGGPGGAKPIDIGAVINRALRAAGLLKG